MKALSQNYVIALLALLFLWLMLSNRKSAYGAPPCCG